MLVTCTRVWLSDKAGWRRLRTFIAQALSYSSFVIVGVRVELDSVGTLAFLEELGASEPRLLPLPIRPWYDVCGPLNALLYAAATVGRRNTNTNNHFNDEIRNEQQFVLFQSVEVECDADAVRVLMDRLTPAASDVLVAGARLPHSHTFSVGRKLLDGLNTPWNTFAIWHIDTLAKTGFLSVSDGIAGPTGAAIEEVCTASIFQHLAETTNNVSLRRRSLLVHLPRVRWLVDFEEPARKQHHELKMRTKMK